MLYSLQNLILSRDVYCVCLNFMVDPTRFSGGARGMSDLFNCQEGNARDCGTHMGKKPHKMVTAEKRESSKISPCPSCTRRKAGSTNEPFLTVFSP